MMIKSGEKKIWRWERERRRASYVVDEEMKHELKWGKKGNRGRNKDRVLRKGSKGDQC